MIGTAHKLRFFFFILCVLLTLRSNILLRPIKKLRRPHKYHYRCGISHPRGKLCSSNNYSQETAAGGDSSLLDCGNGIGNQTNHEVTIITTTAAAVTKCKPNTAQHNTKNQQRHKQQNTITFKPICSQNNLSKSSIGSIYLCAEKSIHVCIYKNLQM